MYKKKNDEKKKKKKEEKNIYIANLKYCSFLYRILNKLLNNHDFFVKKSRHL